MTINVLYHNKIFAYIPLKFKEKNIRTINYCIPLHRITYIIYTKIKAIKS